ncbi:hypothetical protein GB927_012670 [Shinella sp. CPCC 100929]|uniref:Uncharacterized protein n=1 Tax=Shinella lacus TaxID=2654216 RepID=A0ABT1R6T2_9HYPH|nr:hypothetical protein [Shinella lacus]MCQ4630899.1 hypothetical protein [Shinella lacus]
MTDRMTADEMLVARINAMERRIAQLEGWTGADEDGATEDGEVSVAEQLLAQDSIITNLLRYLEVVAPGFSVAELRGKILRMEKEHFEQIIKTQGMPKSQARRLYERSCRIIVDHLPMSRHDEPAKDQRRSPQLTLVGAAPKNDDEPPAQP